MNINVPVEVLAIDSESGEPVRPASGDEVHFACSGTIHSIDGAMAEVEITGVNGQPIPDPAEGSEPEGEMDGDELRGMAAQFDDQ